MPIYDAYCHKCKRTETYVRSVANCLDTPECCGEKMAKVILSAPMGYVHNIAYTSPIDGRPITTKQQRADDLARSGSRPWEGLDQEKKEAARKKAYQEQKEDAKIEKVVSEAYYSLAPEKRRVLETSL